MAQTWWVAAQDRATGVAYVVVASGDNQFPSGDLPSISEASGPYSTQAAAQAVADALNKAPGGSLGVKSPGGFQAWFYNSHTGQVILDTDWLTAQGDMLRTKTGTGWHYYATNADMLAAIAQNHWPAPQYQNSVAQNLANAPKVAGGTGLAGLAAIGDFFARLTDPHFAIRAVEVVLGVGLILWGVNKMSDGKLSGAVKGTVKAAGKVIP